MFENLNFSKDFCDQKKQQLKLVKCFTIFKAKGVEHNFASLLRILSLSKKRGRTHSGFKLYRPLITNNVI